MNTNRLIVAIPLFLLALLLLAPQADAAQREVRTFFQFQNETRSLQKIGNKRWAQFINGQQTRQYDEVSRNQDYIEIYTEVPAPTWVRIFNNRVLWRGAGEINWRVGNPGSWVVN
jgi:hypothetical protein